LLLLKTITPIVAVTDRFFFVSFETVLHNI
jgi:hypothetical protein